MAGGTPGMKPSTSVKPSFTPQESRGGFSVPDQSHHSASFLDAATSQYLLDQRFLPEASASNTLDGHEQLDVLADSVPAGVEEMFNLSGLTPESSNFSQVSEHGPVEIYNAANSTRPQVQPEHSYQPFQPFPDFSEKITSPTNNPEAETPPSTNTFAEALQSLNGGQNLAAEISPERKAEISYQERTQARIAELRQTIIGYSGKTYTRVSGREALVSPTTNQHQVEADQSELTFLSWVRRSIKREEKVKTYAAAFAQKNGKRSRKGPGLFEGGKEGKFDAVAQMTQEIQRHAPHELTQGE